VAPRPIVDPLFAQALRRLRDERGLSLRDLADLAVYGKSYLHELETGRKQPNAAVAARLDQALQADGRLPA
jgi:transcriptional regulator with XRE-family HTH domain